MKFIQNLFKTKTSNSVYLFSKELHFEVKLSFNGLIQKNFYCTSSNELSINAYTGDKPCPFMSKELKKKNPDTKCNHHFSSQQMLFKQKLNSLPTKHHFPSHHFLNINLNSNQAKHETDCKFKTNKCLWFLNFAKTKLNLFQSIRSEATSVSQKSNLNPQNQKQFYENHLNCMPYSSIPEVTFLIPVLGSLISLIKHGGISRLHQYCDKMHKKLGPIYKQNLGTVEGVFIGDSQLIEQMFSQEDNSPTHLIPEPWIIYNKVYNIQRGLFFLNGEAWKKQRTCLNGLFLKKGSLSDYMGFFTDVIDDMLYKWEKSVELDSNFIIPELEKQLYSWSIESLGTVIFGRRLGCIPEYSQMDANPDYNTEKKNQNYIKVSKIQEEFNSAVRQIFVETGKMQLIPAKIAYKFNLPVWRRFVEANHKALQIAKSYVQENIKENELNKQFNVSSSSLDGNEMLQMDNKDNRSTNQRGIGILNELLKYPHLEGPHLDNIITDLFLAATDTTSHSAQWALYLIAKNPQCQQKIIDEVNSILKPGEVLGESHLKELNYTRGIVKETLRLYPVAPFISRIFSKDIKVGNYHIPKNKLVCLSLYTIGRMENHYKDAEKFMPERWIRTDKRKKVNSYAYIPFALGSRSCIGRKVAEAQMIFFITKLVQKFKIELGKDEIIDIKLRMITTPEKPISLKLTKR